MAYYINNQPTADGYTSENELGPFFDADTATVLVSGAPVAFQFFVGDAGHGRWTDEREFVAAAGNGTTNSFKVGNIRGVRAKSANPGSPAVFSITLFRTGVTYDSNDPIFEAGTLSPGSISASGTVTNAVSAGAKIAEALLSADVAITATLETAPDDVIDLGSFAFTGADIYLELFLAHVQQSGSNGSIVLDLWDMAGTPTNLGRIAHYFPDSSVASGIPIAVRTPTITPTPGTHDYRIRAWCSAGTGTVKAGGSYLDGAFRAVLA